MKIVIEIDEKEMANFIKLLKNQPSQNKLSNDFISDLQEALEKRMTELEKEVQSQPLEIISALTGIRREELTKSKPVNRCRLNSKNQSGEQV